MSDWFDHCAMGRLAAKYNAGNSKRLGRASDVADRERAENQREEKLAD
jgi:hypothetical protein